MIRKSKVNNDNEFVDFKKEVCDTEPTLIRYLTSKDFVKRISGEVDPEWIIDNPNKTIFNIIVEFYKSSGHLPDANLVKQEIIKRDIDVEESINIYQSIQNFESDLFDAEYNLVRKQVESNYLRNFLIKTMREASSIISSQKSPQESLSFLEDQIAGLKNQIYSNNIINYDISEFSPIALERYSTSFNEEEIISCGIKELNEKMGGGFRKPNLVGLGSGTQGGKSIVSMNMGYSAYKEDLSVAYVSLEMSEEELLARLHSRMSEIPVTKILMRDLDLKTTLRLRKMVLLEAVDPECYNDAKKIINLFGNELASFSKEEIEEKFFENSKILRRRNTFFPIDIASGCSVEIIKSQISQLKEKRGCDVLIIDYPGIMNEVLSGEQSWHSYSNLYAELKALARSLDVVLIVPIQSQEDGSYKYSTAIRDHIDIGLNWKRTTDDVVKKRVRFWFTKLRHSKIEVDGDSLEHVNEFQSEEDDDFDTDYSLKNPIFASLNTEIMKLDNYTEIGDEWDFSMINA